MRKDAWLCANDEHINKNDDTHCEICSEKRPVLESLSYELTDIFGKINLVWKSKGADEIQYIRKKDEVLSIPKNGKTEINSVTNYEIIYLKLTNEITTYYQPIKILLEKPHIVNFGIIPKEVLKHQSIDIVWEIKNATQIKITHIGNVEAKGIKTLRLEKTISFILNAKNKIGQVREEIAIKVLPLPEIKAFKSKHSRLEYGKETQLNWEVLNVEKVRLITAGKTEIVEQKGNITISPAKNTLYKIVATALDGKTTIEKELTVKVFKRVKINSFQSNLDFVVESLPITLSWDVENASKLLLTRNSQPDIDVTGKSDLKLKPKRNTVLFLKASNDLFSAQERLEIEVQALPSMPSIQNIIPNSKELIPTFNLDFQNISDSILSKSELNFEKMMKPINGFSLKSSISKIVNAIRKNGI